MTAQHTPDQIMQTCNMDERTNEEKLNTPSELIPAIRQYRHNIGGNEFVMGYDIEITEEVVRGLQQQNAELSALNSELAQTVEKLLYSNGELSAQVAELKYALKRYGRHDRQNCDYYLGHCHCGFTQTIAKAGKP